MWITRDAGKFGLGGGAYHVYRSRPHKGCPLEPVHIFCAKAFECMTGFMLKPSDGPVRCKVVRVK